MGFGLDRDAKDYRDDREAPLMCLSCARRIKSGWRCWECEEAERGVPA
jgi:hypothetical protein